MAAVSIRFVIILIELLGAATVAVILLIESMKTVVISPVDMTAPNMLMSDWNTVPYTEIIVDSATEVYNGCSLYSADTPYFPLFNSTWPGTVEGCQLGGGDMVMTKEDYTA